MLAMIVARRPTTSPSASIRCHFFSTSCGLADLVVFISAFMAWTLFERRAPPHEGRRRPRANGERGWRSQGKAALCRKVACYHELFHPLARLAVLLYEGAIGQTIRRGGSRWTFRQLPACACLSSSSCSWA